MNNINFKPITIFFLLILSTSYARNYDGKTKTVEFYHAAGDTKESFKTIWFCPTFEEYTTKEEENFDNHHIAYYKGSFQRICTESEEKMLNMLNIQTGMYEGNYYPISQKKKKENMQNTYLAYFSVPLSVYNIHVEFIGVQRQYMLNYDLETPKEHKGKIAFFRIPSGDTRYEDDYLITAQVTSEKVTIKSTYNYQNLTITLTPKENLYLTYMRKWGFNNRVLINIQDSTTTLADSIAKIADQH